MKNRYTGNAAGLERNDDATSLQLPPGCCVDLYEHGNYGGKVFKTCESVVLTQLDGQNWNDQASSLKTYKAPPG